MVASVTKNKESSYCIIYAPDKEPSKFKKKMKKQKELGKWLCGQNASCAHMRVPNTQVRTGMKAQVCNPSAGETHPGGWGVLANQSKPDDNSQSSWNQGL